MAVDAGSEGVEHSAGCSAGDEEESQRLGLEAGAVTEKWATLEFEVAGPAVLVATTTTSSPLA